MPWAVLGRAPSYSCIWTAKQLPATSISTKTSQIGVTVGWDPWKVNLFESKVEKLLHNPYITGIPTNEGIQESESLLSQNRGFTQEAKKKKNQENLCM